jgi:hypothetical protein
MFKNATNRIVNFAKEQAKSARGGLLYAGEEVVQSFVDPKSSKKHMARAAMSAGKGVKSAYQYGMKGSLAFALPVAALGAATADRGHKASAALGALAPPIGAVVGGLLGGAPGAMLGGFLIDTKLQEMVTSGVQLMIDAGQATKSLDMGAQNAHLVQTDGAYTMRQRAARDMSGSLLNARQYLGRESVLFHD